MSHRIQLESNLMALAARRCRGLPVGGYAAFVKAEPAVGRIEALARYPELAPLRAYVQMHWTELESDYAALLATDTQVISLGSAEYPWRVAEIHDPPPMLQVEGAPLVDRPRGDMVAIVGARNADSEGMEVAEHLALELAQHGICIVSGLAAGIDGAAHRGALLSGESGATIAVLGSGLDIIYPALNRALARDIVSQGSSIVSQFERPERPFPQNFLNRNRVIAGLADLVVVIQAGERSGSLVTARLANEEGREVCVVPGSVRSPHYRGSHYLIRQGAHLVTSVGDILEHLPGVRRVKEKAIKEPDAVPKGTNPLAIQIRAALDEALPYETLANRFAGTEGFAETLLELELAGAVVRRPGNLLIGMNQR